MDLRGLLMVAVAGAMLAGCETAEGYRQQMTTWQGRPSDDIVIQWGQPAKREVLSDGREVWIYNKTTEQHIDSYYKDEQRQVKRTFTDKDGKQKTETITETYPVLQPARTVRSSCETRFVLAQKRVEQVTFTGDACVAEEKRGSP
jgi:outer membrane lipoprotein-sorting protein